MKVWMFVLVFGLSVGTWSGWEIRGKLENNLVAAATKATKNWIAQFNPQSKSNHPKSSNAKSKNVNSSDGRKDCQ
ncbi:MAG TPA: hypothetical protein VK211_13165 [Kamptonema sp.]|nr:hypothetical protein [Kamptonema sp.]